jgi:hypothetical protein
MDELYKRVNTGVQGGWITIGEARKVVGLEADERHSIYLRPLNTVQITEDGQPLLERDRFSPEDEGKSLLGTVAGVPESTRQDIIESPQRLSEDKYIAEMPNGAFCVLSHKDNEVIKCFKTKPEAEKFLASMKKALKEMEDIKVSTEEADALQEVDSDSWRSEKKEKPKKDRTNFPSPGEDKKVSIANSKYKEFPFAYAKDLKENWPEIWRLAGNGGNPPTSFTGNDAYRNWAKYKAGDRSESVLNWVRRRERYMGRHQGNTRLNGTIANIKWGGASNIGVPAMKKIIAERKTLVRERRKKSLELQGEILDDLFAQKVSANVRKILTNKVKEHNDKNPKHRANLRTLIAVFKRGVGAYRTNPGSVRGNVTSSDQWAIARVNGFLHALRTGRFKRKPYDQDLLPSSHPLSSKKDGQKASSVRVGQSVKWSINKDPDPPSTVHGVVVSVKDKEATMQVWAILENGSHKKTDRRVTQPISKLTVIKDITKEKTLNSTNPA